MIISIDIYQQDLCELFVKPVIPSIIPVGSQRVQPSDKKVNICRAVI
ncbi:MAG: hypothetical protein JWM28_2728 [Chitinophagaceae bacterium]|nr:hypothetical protein [Chitinophagaceae bacterium]